MQGGVRYAAAAAALPMTLLLAGCGYVGPVVPPSPKIPDQIRNLGVVERGDQIIITFNTPPRTTDFLPIEKFSSIDLRIGPAAQPFNLQQWEATARVYSVPQQLPEGDEAEAKSIPVTRTLPVSEWSGKKIYVLVRTAVKKRGHYSSWSDPVTLDVVAPISPPELSIGPVAAGYKLTWTGSEGATRFQILRQGPGEKTPSVIGFSDQPEYVDGTAQWDTRYAYNVIAQSGKAESLPSNAVIKSFPDTFPPAVPTGVVALAAPDSIELSWKRNDELDFKSYEVFRSVNKGPFEPLAASLTLPSYSDRKVEHGKNYRYSIGAIDQKNNRSEHSQPVEVTY